MDNLSFPPPIFNIANIAIGIYILNYMILSLLRLAVLTSNIERMLLKCFCTLVKSD